MHAQTDRQTHRQTDRHTDTQTHRHTDTQTHTRVIVSVVIISSVVVISIIIVIITNVMIVRIISISITQLLLARTQAVPHGPGDDRSPQEGHEEQPEASGRQADDTGDCKAHSGEEDMWEDKLSEHHLRGADSIFCCRTAHEGSHERNCLFADAGKQSSNIASCLCDGHGER